jgi:hypothetical protein
VTETQRGMIGTYGRDEWLTNKHIKKEVILDYSWSYVNSRVMKLRKTNKNYTEMQQTKQNEHIQIFSQNH